jgi:hypothetical protein
MYHKLMVGMFAAAALTVSSPVIAQPQFGTAAEAKALLHRRRAESRQGHGVVPVHQR